MIFSTRSRDGHADLFDPAKPVRVGVDKRDGTRFLFDLPPGTEVTRHPSGNGFIAVHPDHPATWCKFDHTTEVIKP